MKRELTAILIIAYRDIVRLLRDRMRLVANLIFPAIFIGALGTSLQANLGQTLSYNFLTFVFIGVLAQTMFQSTASGIISMIEDRQNNFAQALYVTPISRYTLLIGKVLGELGVSMVQGTMVVMFSVIMGVPIDGWRLLAIIPVALLAGLFGGAFGTVIMAGFREQRSANQIFPFVLFPQFFLAGVFNPIQQLPLPLLILSRISPMTYAVDLLRTIYYWGSPEYEAVVLFNPVLNLTVVGVATIVFVVIGTRLFVRGERNK
jgi:ABC-2 type transport system permease protein